MEENYTRKMWRLGIGIVRSIIILVCVVMILLNGFTPELGFWTLFLSIQEVENSIILHNSLSK